MFFTYEPNTFGYLDRRGNSLGVFTHWKNDSCSRTDMAVFMIMNSSPAMRFEVPNLLQVRFFVQWRIPSLNET